MDIITLGNDVKAVHEKILEVAKVNEAVKKLYGGCQIFYSPFYKNADVMLIGINPGTGFQRHEGKIVESFFPLETYEDEYTFIDEIMAVFEKAGKEDIMDTTVRTNKYFFSTYGTGKLADFLAILPLDLKNEIYEKSEYWFSELIRMVSPKMIFCAGTTVFNEMQAFHKSEMTVTQGTGTPREATFAGIPVLACQRMVGGRMLPGKNRENITRLEEKLHDYMVKLGILT